MRVRAQILRGGAIEKAGKITQLHEANVGIRVIEFGQEVGDAHLGAGAVSRHDDGVILDGEATRFRQVQSCARYRERVALWTLASSREEKVVGGRWVDQKGGGRGEEERWCICNAEMLKRFTVGKQSSHRTFP